MKKSTYPDGAKGIKTKTGSYAASTAPQLQGKRQSKSQQDLNEMSANYADDGAAIRSVIPVGNQSYTDFQRTRKSPAGQKAKEDYETSNKLPRLTDADYQGRVYKQGLGTLSKTASDNPGTSVFTDTAKDAAYGAKNKTSMEMGNQVSGSNGSVVDKASLANRSSRMSTGSAYTAPGMGIQTRTTKVKPEVIPTPETKSYASYPQGSKGIKTKGGMSNFINGESDKVNNMSDKDLDKAVKSNMNYTSSKQNAVEDNLLTETVNRKWKKQGGYAMGTKGIKTKKMC